jgi:hypothetical protein
MRAFGLLVACLFCVILMSGCGGDSDKKGINKDRDRPLPQPKAAAPAGPPGVAAKEPGRRGL